MTDDELEYLHSQGKVPDWWYYQKSKKPVWMKWQEQGDKFIKEVEQTYEQRRQEQEKKRQQEQELKRQQEQEREIQDKVEVAVDNALGDLFKDFL